MALAEAHDLARDAQSDAVALWLGAEEGDEDMGCYFGRNLLAAVAYLDDYGFGFVAVGTDVDFARSLLHGPSGWGVGCGFLLSDGLDSILQQVGHHLADELFVGIEQQVGWLHRYVEADALRAVLVLSQVNHAFDKRFYAEHLGGRSWQ